MNLIVTEVPFDEDDSRARRHQHGRSSSSTVGHWRNPDLSVTVDYITAKAILVDATPGGHDRLHERQDPPRGRHVQADGLPGRPTDESAIEFALRVRR